MEAILSQLQAHGSLIVGVNVFLQQLGLPIPSVPTMMVAGAVAALAGAGLWVGASVAVGDVFARRAAVVLASMPAHAALALTAVVGALASHIGFRAVERYRLGRYVVAARIAIDEFRELLAGEP